ncbi:hypothetical protein TrCOL_g1132 [Triparma columacea]|uniref:CID domain-containing protein n=1 Tax=Triparma columacea TaxID=722753 RepID=A0A9W7L8Q3_9STRA|nr:hypothetical protein TrCOL_g1132 [Triparma columacea]
MKQQEKKTRVSSDVGREERLSDDMAMYRNPSVPHNPPSAPHRDSAHQRDPTYVPVRRTPLHQSMTSVESSSLRASLTRLGPTPTVGSVKSAMMSLFPYPQKAHSAVETVRAYVEGSAPPSGCNPEDFPSRPGGGDLLGLLYLLSDLLHNSNGSILAGAFLWKNAIGGYLPELLGRMGEAAREEGGGEGGKVEKGVKRVFESWLKWDVWEESKGEYFKGCYEGTKGGEGGGDGNVTDFEDPIDGEEMTEAELLEFGLDLR